MSDVVNLTNAVKTTKAREYLFKHAIKEYLKQHPDTSIHDILKLFVHDMLHSLPSSTKLNRDFLSTSFAQALDSERIWQANKYHQLIQRKRQFIKK